MIGISKIQLDIIRKILRKYVPNHIIWAFGSRVTGHAKQYSDLDLALISDESLPPSIMGQLRESFSESDLPFKVDLVYWATVSVAFQTIIKTKYEKISLKIT